MSAKRPATRQASFRVKGVHALGALATVAALAISGCQRGGGSGGTEAGSQGASSDSGGNSILVAVAAPMTGDSAAFGQQIQKGVTVGRDQINEAGGINGKKIALDFNDDEGRAQSATNVATRIASNPEVRAVVGHFNSACSNAGKPLYTQAGIPMLSPASTAVSVTKDSDLVFRNIFTDAFQGQSLADYAGKVLGFKKVAILYDNDDYGIGLKDSFTNRANEIGVQITGATAYNKDTSDFRSQLTTTQAQAPDAILVAGLYTQAAAIARQARELGIQAPLMGGDGVFSDEYIKLAGPAAEGTYITSPFLFELGGARAKEFSDAFRAKFNADPDAWAALSFDALNMILEGMKKNGATREGVVTYLKSLNSPENAYDGLTGKTFFDAEGDCKKPVQVALVQGGKMTAAEKQLSAEGNVISSAELASGAAAAAGAPAAPGSADQPSPPANAATVPSNANVADQATTR